MLPGRRDDRVAGRGDRPGFPQGEGLGLRTGEATQGGRAGARDAGKFSPRGEVAQAAETQGFEAVTRGGCNAGVTTREAAGPQSGGQKEYENA